MFAATLCSSIIKCFSLNSLKMFLYEKKNIKMILLSEVLSSFSNVSHHKKSTLIFSFVE